MSKREKALRKAATIASLFMQNHRLHPSLDNRDLNEGVKVACHSLCQQIALLILAEIEK